MPPDLARHHRRTEIFRAKEAQAGLVSSGITAFRHLEKAKPNIAPEFLAFRCHTFGYWICWVVALDSRRGPAPLYHTPFCKYLVWIPFHPKHVGTTIDGRSWRTCRMALGRQEVIAGLLLLLFLGFLATCCDTECFGAVGSSSNSFL